jgi:predicted MFS family arabinose efflux permease
VSAPPSITASPSTAARAASLAVIVAALGYFVDIYDLILFAMVRTPSVKALGGDVTADGIYLFNMQMGGMLVGGVLWGVLGDKRGRLSVLFGSIALYSVANLANAFVHGIDSYAACRLVAGIGLAGELGAGITLVSELMGRERRGVGTTLVAGLGVSGGVVAGLIGGALPGVWGGVEWRTAYIIGGALGLVLLALRIGVAESGMFHQAKARAVARGNFFSLFGQRRRALRYLAIIAVGVPVWFFIGILMTFSRELGGALGLPAHPNPATALFFCYGGAALGGLGCGALSQRLRSRRRAIGAFLVALTVAITAYFTIGGRSLGAFYALAGIGGFTTGYWSVFIATAAELFGTNLRSTVTTTVPNVVRGSAVLLTIAFKGLGPALGWVGAALVVGVATMAVGALGLWSLEETFGIDLDFLEE